MTTTDLQRLDQRLNQHAYATEIILKQLDQIVANGKRRGRCITLLETRLREIESIVLPDSDKP